METARLALNSRRIMKMIHLSGDRQLKIYGSHAGRLPDPASEREGLHVQAEIPPPARNHMATPTSATAAEKRDRSREPKLPRERETDVTGVGGDTAACTHECSHRSASTEAGPDP